MRLDAIMMSKKEIVFRYCLFIIGLFIASLGVAFSTKAGLGTSPVASVPYSVSLLSTGLTFGGWMNLWSVLQISVQVFLLRKRCKVVEIVIQTILAFVYGYMTDFSCSLLGNINPNGYVMQFVVMLIGCVVLAFGIWIQFKGGVAMLSGEAMNRAISTVTGKKYENVKILFDIIYILVSVAICMIAFGKLSGVREGSLVAAVLVGNVIKFYNWIFEKIKTLVKR